MYFVTVDEGVILYFYTYRVEAAHLHKRLLGYPNGVLHMQGPG